MAKVLFWNIFELRNAKLKKQEEKRVAKEEIKFVKKRGEKGVKQMFGEEDEAGPGGVRKSPMKKGGQVFFKFI